MPICLHIIYTSIQHEAAKVLQDAIHEFQGTCEEVSSRGHNNKIGVRCKL